MKSVFAALSIVLVASLASASEFITQAEIENSKLSQTEKGMAMSAVLTKPVITCVSTNEGIGADSERLQIYFVEVGNVFKASIAVWKAYGNIKVFGSFDDANSLKAAYAAGKSSSFGTEEGRFTNSAVTVSYDHVIPMLGKATSVEFAAGGIAEQICSLAK